MSDVSSLSYIRTMKKTFSIFFLCVCLSAITLHFSSCGKERSTPPNISFNTSVAYISNDTSLVHGTVFSIGIIASKTQTDGILSGCKIYYSVNNSPDSLIQEMNFVTQYFSQVFSYTAADSGNVERYTFTVSKRDGQSNSASLTVTDI